MHKGAGTGYICRQRVHRSSRAPDIPFAMRSNLQLLSLTTFVATPSSRLTLQQPSSALSLLTDGVTDAEVTRQCGEQSLESGS